MVPRIAASPLLCLVIPWVAEGFLAALASQPQRYSLALERPTSYAGNPRVPTVARRRRARRSPSLSALEAPPGVSGSEGGFDVPLPSSNELVRLELKEVPAEAARKWLREWGGRRVPDRPDVDASGVPRTNMPVTATVKDGGGLRLSFDASPTDIVDLDIFPLARGASCLVAAAGEEGMARRGLLGPQIQSLVNQAEDRIWQKLQRDLIGFAREYHYSSGAATAAPRKQQRQPASPSSAGRSLPLEDATFTDKDYSDAGSGGSAGGGVGEPYPEPQREHKGAKGTAFPGGRFADPTEDIGLDSRFRQNAFEMFESVRLGEIPNSDGGVKGFEGVLEGLKVANATESQLSRLFEEGEDVARRGGEDQLMMPLDKDLVQLGLMLDGTGLQGGMDIFSGPPRAIGTDYVSPAAAAAAAAAAANAAAAGGAAAAAAGETELVAPEMYVLCDEDGEPLVQLTAEEAARVDEDELEMEMIRMDVLVSELLRAPEERFLSIAANYKDVLLSDYYLLAMRARVARLSSERERTTLGRINGYATTLVREVAMMGQELELQQLEKIRTICEAAMEDMSRLPDRVRGMRPLLDGDFLAYLQYAIDVEKGKIRANAQDPAREPTTWLQVLGVIQRGVLAELAKDVYLDVQAISYVLRMPSQEERRALLELTISKLPSMDVRGFKKAANNIVANVAQRAELDDDLRLRVAEFAIMVAEVLPDHRVEALSAEADEGARLRIEGLQSRAELAAAPPAASAGYLGTGVFDKEEGLIKEPVPDLVAKYGLTEEEDDDEDLWDGLPGGKPSAGGETEDAWQEIASGDEWGSYDGEGAAPAVDPGVPPALRNACLPPGVADDELGW